MSIIPSIDVDKKLNNAVDTPTSIIRTAVKKDDNDTKKIFAVGTNDVIYIRIIESIVIIAPNDICLLLFILYPHF